MNEVNRKYYFGTVIPMLMSTDAFCDMTKAEMHKYLKDKFLSEYGLTSTTRMDNDVAEDYLKRIREWASLPPVMCFIPRIGEDPNILTKQ